MTFDQQVQLPSSKKVTLLEIDTPISGLIWLNYQPGIWFTRLTPGNELVIDDFGEEGFWEGQNTQYFNIQSLNVQGTQYNEVGSIAAVIATEKTWFYDTTTTDMYIHFEDWNPHEFYSIVSPGAAIGFTFNDDTVKNNYYEDVYYEPLIKSIPNLVKKKDPLFFGILQYNGGTITMENTGGFFDEYATLDLYGQPLRIKLSFEGLEESQIATVYTGKVEDFSHNFTEFKIRIADVRKLLSRKLPINNFNLTDYPSIDSKLVGTPIPIAFGQVTRGPAYKTSAGNWTFYDDEFNDVDAGIVVFKEDGTVFANGGTETDGTFTGADTDEDLTVTFYVPLPIVSNGLDVISDVLANYENVAFNAFNYDLTEWNNEKVNVKDFGMWIGKGNLMTSVDIIEQVCNDNQGIFDVLSDGRFTFRTLNTDGEAVKNIEENELMVDPSISYPSKEYLSSVRVEWGYDVLNDSYQILPNDSFQDEVYGRYRQYKERSFVTALDNSADAETLSNSIMDQSKFIFPTITLKTKTQNIGLRVLDNLTYTYQRQNGKIIIDKALFQVLGINLNLTSYEITVTIKFIKDVSNSAYLQRTTKLIPDMDIQLLPSGEEQLAVMRSI